MTGRNRHSYWQAGGGHKAALFRLLRWIGQKDFYRTHETYLSGRIQFSGDTGELRVKHQFAVHGTAN